MFKRLKNILRRLFIAYIQALNEAHEFEMSIMRSDPKTWGMMKAHQDINRPL
jgi:hypothetical protein